MKAIEWQQFLQEQHKLYNKVIFTTTELANIASSDLASTRVTIQRLVTMGVLERYAAGRYGLPGVAETEDIVPALDNAAYITGMYALYRHQIITQTPTEVLCFTNRRHNRSRIRMVSGRRLVFICLTGAVYSPPVGEIITGPEQALCDFIYNCRRRGLVANDLVTLRNLDRLDHEQLELCLLRYPKSVIKEVYSLLKVDASRKQQHK